MRGRTRRSELPGLDARQGDPRAAGERGEASSEATEPGRVEMEKPSAGCRSSRNVRTFRELYLGHLMW